MDDHRAVARQLGREPRPFNVAARCLFDFPSVIENEPRRNMPTSHWITCRVLQAAISRVESAGGVRDARRELGTEVVDDIHAEHTRRFGGRVAGVGSAGGHIKCLHAFTALHLSGALPNAVAEWTLNHLDHDPYARLDRCCAADIEEAAD